MDPHAFDSLTRLFRTSRRTAWRALCGAALLGTTARRAPAAPRRKNTCGTCPKAPNGGPSFCCNGKHCSCNGMCCNNRCFVSEGDAPKDELCCTGPKFIICENKQTGELICCQKVGEDPCRTCVPPLGPSGITGSYRRR